MELEEDQNGYPGRIPEFGAIFMSNTRTKVECFRRKLFGLPFGQAPFVKQIKAGMLLFLFEFERREMHGVYQASTDGAMNIVPHAYSSFGKQFPAQVKFTHLWQCSPLSEDEFREAIKENYYSAKKFNFGLSEDQVHKLLYLFDLKKLKPQGHITGQKYARYSVDKVRRAADDQKSIISTQGEEADISRGSLISNDHFNGACLGSDGRTIDDGRFARSAGVDGAAISTFYPRQFELSSTSCRLMEPQAMNLTCPTSTGDAIVVSCLPYDPDAPLIESRHLSSYVHNSNPVQNFAFPPNNNAENVLPSSENQSFLPYTEPRRARCPDFSSMLGYGAPMASPNHYGNSQRILLWENNNAENVLPSSENQSILPYTEPRRARCPDFSSMLGYGAPMASPNHYGNSQRTRMPFLEASYSENMAANPSENEGCSGFSFSRPGPLPFADSGNSEGMDGGTSFSFSPSQYPSFLFDYGCREASQDENYQKMMQCGINLKEGTNQLHGPVYPVKFNIDHQDNSSLKPDDVCKNPGGMYFDCQKNRKSVFSRLALAPKARIREYDTLVGVDEDSMDTSVDEVMSMLHQSHYQWFKIRKQGQFFNVDTTDFRKKRQTTSDSKLLKDRFKKISDEVRMKDIPASEENRDQLAEKMPFVDFKRRSGLRKSHGSDSKIDGCGWSAENECCAGGLHKRRKLIRPNFSKNELIDDKTMNVDTQKLELLHQSSHISHADNNIEAKRVSTCKENSLEIYGATFSNVIQVGKELSQNVDIGTISSSISEEGLTNKDSVMDRLFQDLNSSTHSVQQESLLEACEGSNNGIASGVIECSRNMQLYPNLECEVAVGTVNDSYNQTPKLERASEEVIASECNSFKVDIQQNDDDGNALFSSGCEIITGQCHSTSSN